jgi:hypothetical protein
MATEETRPLLTNLVDSSFDGLSFTLAGDNLEEGPRFIEWDRRHLTTGGPVFFTDKHVGDVADWRDYPGKKVALLIEPPSLNVAHYTEAWERRDDFDAILTFNTKFWRLDPSKILYYPLGGSWIAPDLWGVWPKSKDLSIITSQKHGAPGHQMRHWIASTYGERMDRWGRDYRPMASKATALAPYRFSIVVESVRMPGYFSEKLIDCLAVGTTPIYYGAPDITNWFTNLAVVQFENAADLRVILRNLPDLVKKPSTRLEALNIARALRCAEDRIYQHYRGLWDNDNEQKKRRSDLRKAGRADRL